MASKTAYLFDACAFDLQLQEQIIQCHFRPCFPRLGVFDFCSLQLVLNFIGLPFIPCCISISLFCQQFPICDLGNNSILHPGSFIFFLHILRRDHALHWSLFFLSSTRQITRMQEDFIIFYAERSWAKPSVVMGIWIRHQGQFVITSGMEARTYGVSVEVVNGATLDGVECDSTFTLWCDSGFSASGSGGSTVTVGCSSGGCGRVVLVVGSCRLGGWGAGINCGGGGGLAIVEAFFRRMRQDYLERRK